MATPSKKRAPFENRYLAFVDILGFRSVVERMPKESRLFFTIRDALKSLDRQAMQFQKYRSARNSKRRKLLRSGRVPLFWDTDLQMTAFSDCYVISETSPAWHVLAAVQALGAHLLAEGVLTRGAVVQGKVYHRGRVLFGPAVIEAYELEKEVAKYPRILVTDAVREATWGYHQGVCRSRLFRQDVDGCWFVNVLAPPLSRWGALTPAASHKDLQEFLRQVRHSLKGHVEQSERNLAHRSKVSWLVHQFNAVAKKEGLQFFL